jgi:uncharacterized caspase-like protein
LLLRTVGHGGGRDTVVLFFSGHGCREGDDFYFATHETNLNNLKSSTLSWKTAAEIIRRIAQKSRRVLVLIDACYSGVAGETSGERLVRGLRDEGVMVLASSQSSEVSLEMKQLGHGAFTKALLDVMRGDCCPDRIELKPLDLWQCVWNRVSELTHRQQNPIALPGNRPGNNTALFKRALS